MGDPVELAMSNHVLKEGLYILIEENKEGGIICRDLLIEREGEYTGKIYEAIRERDYLSNLIEMNKPVDQNKKIHSNNIYSLAFKYGGLPKIVKDEEKSVNIFSYSNMEMHINRYFGYLKNWYKDYKNILQNTPVKPPETEKIRKNKDLFLRCIPEIVKLIEKHDLKAGKYIKIFINAPLSEYKEANELYLLPKIFNNNKSNVEVEGITYGLSNANMGLNAKKPYLSHMTTKYKVPYRITLPEAIDAYNLLVWLNSQNEQGKPKNNGYLTYEQSDEFALLERVNGNTPAQYVHFTREKTGVEIDDYDVIPYAQKDLDENFKLVNYLKLPQYECMTITQMSKLEGLIDEVLFNKSLVRNYYFEPKPKTGILSAKQASIIQLSKNAFISYFKKSDKTAIRNMIDKVSMEMILEKLNQIDFHMIEYTSFAKALNLRYVLLQYFEIGGKDKLGSQIINIYEELKTIILNDKPVQPVVCERDDMFFFAVGQLARYLVSLSKAQKVNYSFINPLLKARDSKRIKHELAELIKKYSHEIDVWNNQLRSRFDNLQAFINSYEYETDDNKVDLILAGFASPNLIYYKKEKED